MSNMTLAIETVLKTDAAGRIKTPPERRERLLEEFERSGLSGIEFAKLSGIKYQTFAAWVARRRKQRALPPVPAQPADPVRWLEAVVTEAKPPVCDKASVLRLQLPAGIWLEVTDLKQVPLAAALLQALERKLPPC